MPAACASLLTARPLRSSGSATGYLAATDLDDLAGEVGRPLQEQHAADAADVAMCSIGVSGSSSPLW